MDTRQHKFSEVPNTSIPRSLFNRSSNLKTAIGVDYLYPIYVDEALPADTWKFSATFFGRLTSLVCPTLDNLYLDVFFFAVPYRLVDKNWHRVLGERQFGDTSTEYTVPTMKVKPIPRSLSDYLGLPVYPDGDWSDDTALEICPYWHRAYNLIWNEWFRADYIQAPVKVAGVSYDGTVSTETESDYVLLKRGKRHDYFTSCLPTPQRGDPVTLSFSQNAPVIGDGQPILGLGVSNTNPETYTGTGVSLNQGASGSAPYVRMMSGNTMIYNSKFALSPSSELTPSHMFADLSSVSAVEINELYQATAIQRLLYRDNITGDRAIEIIKGHFNVDSPDLRALRPEFLGGFSQPIGITSVPQTSATGVTPQANLAAYGVVSGNGHWIKSFTEHTLILGLANVRADLSYFQGVNRMFSRKTRFDFYWPELANLGEQAVLNKELFVYSDNSDGRDDVFGYQERWSELRYKPSQITGALRESLSVWHLAQSFGTPPTLSSEFIEESVPIGRITAIDPELDPPILLDAFYDVQCARPLPLYSVPGFGNRL